jgi:hypothetical protein
MAEKPPSRPQKRAAPTIDVGYWIAVVLPPDTAPLRCYVGEVQAVDAHGIRLTLIDWLVGMADDFDVFVPWQHIASAFIATPEHDLHDFGRRAGHWQEAMLQKTDCAQEVSDE